MVLPDLLLAVLFHSLWLCWLCRSLGEQGGEGVVAGSQGVRMMFCLSTSLRVDTLEAAPPCVRCFALLLRTKTSHKLVVTLLPSRKNKGSVPRQNPGPASRPQQRSSPFRSNESEWPWLKQNRVTSADLVTHNCRPDWPAAQALQIHLHTSEAGIKSKNKKCAKVWIRVPVTLSGRPVVCILNRRKQEHCEDL